jgi:hypothetical protein
MQVNEVSSRRRKSYLRRTQDCLRSATISQPLFNRRRVQRLPLGWRIATFGIPIIAAAANGLHLVAFSLSVCAGEARLEFGGGAHDG